MGLGRDHKRRKRIGISVFAEGLAKAMAQLLASMKGPDDSRPSEGLALKERGTLRLECRNTVRFPELDRCGCRRRILRGPINF
jgi:hypothetical protein